jgi:hypothetical protein
MRECISDREMEQALMRKCVWCRNYATWYLASSPIFQSGDLGLNNVFRLGEKGWRDSHWVISPIDPNHTFHVEGYLASLDS